MRYEPLHDIRGRSEEIARGLPNDLEREIFWKTVDRIDLEAAEKLQEKWAPAFSEFDRTGPYKYADLPFWIAHKVRMAIQIGVHKSAPLQILDIGMGAGHFGAVCQALGHKVVGTDIVEPIYDDICELLKVERRIEPSARRKPLPDMGRKFDLVTIIWQVFHIMEYLPNGDRVHWTPEDWGFLFDDLIANHLKADGRIYVQLNPNISAEGEAFDAALVSWCEARGARVRLDTGVIDIHDLQRWKQGPKTLRGPKWLNQLFGRAA